MADLWSYSTGTWGVSRVRVYERYPGSPLQIEWTGAKPRSLKTIAGKSVRDRALAIKVAQKMADRLDAAPKTTLRAALGMPERRTLQQLLDRYHKDMEAEWGGKHLRTQRQLKQWWLDRLGPDADLFQIGEPDVEAAVRSEAKRKKWKPRTRQKHLRYILAAFRYGRRKLKWIREADDLTAVDVPKPDRGGPSYTHKEMMALLKHAPEVDWRVDLALNLAYDAQARSEAVRQLKVGDYLGDGQMRFPGETDKAGRARVAILSDTSRWKVEAALRRPDVQRSGHLLPEGKRAIRYDELLGLLRAVEAKAGVPKVERRGWHGVKRRAVTDAYRVAGNIGVVSKQSGTREETLAAIYTQDDTDPKRELAAGLERLRRGA